MMDGLELKTQLQSNERYEAWRAVYRGQPVFAKQAKNQKTRELIAGLPKNSKTVEEIGQKTSFKFRSPKMISQQKDWLVTEWIEGKSLESIVDSESVRLASIMANFFVAFDNEPVDHQGFRHIFSREGLEERIRERLLDKVNDLQLDVVLQAQKKFNQLQSKLTPALQDADIKPDHIFNDPTHSGAYVLIDSEHLSTQWPRFYDIGNVFVKYAMRNNKSFSNIIVATFLDQSCIKPEVLFDPLRTIIIVRCIALHWELDYDEGAEKYNIPRAQRLLKATIEARHLTDLLY